MPLVNHAFARVTPAIFVFMGSESPLESMPSAGAIPPLRRGILAILARYCDTIAAIPPYSAISFRGQLDVRYPPYFVLHANKCQCDRGLYGGYSAIGCYTWKTKSDRV